MMVPMRNATAELRRAYDSFAETHRLSKTGCFITDLVGSIIALPAVSAGGEPTQIVSTLVRDTEPD
jgi:hypothetical protein